MVKVAKIVNRYGNSYMVPIFKAKEMIRNEIIDDFDIIEVKKTKNFEKPQTQKEFERSMNGATKSLAELENEALREQIELLKQKNNLETVKKPVVNEKEEVIVKDEIKIPETVKKPTLNTKK